MTRTSPPQVAFSSGELDPLLHRRFDYQRFQTGLAKCQGFLPLAQGGFTRAPGTFYRGATRDNQKPRLVPFQFSAEDALVLEFTPGFMRVWRYGTLVMNGLDVYELETPYFATSLLTLRWVQSADVIYLCDGIQPIHKLSRLALNNWTITPWTLATGPFRVQNLTETVKLQASASTGSITLTATSALFAGDHVGSLMRLTPTDFTTIPLFTTNEVVAIGQRRRYGKNVYELTANTAPNVGQNPPVHTEGEALTANLTKWKFISDDIGIVRITAVSSATVATATVIKPVPQACVDSPTYRWSEGAWSERYGYPATLEIYDQRLVAAATPSEPRSLWFSAVGDFADWGDNGAVDGPFSYTIAGDGSLNRVMNLRRGRSGLHIFALGEEYSTRSETRAQVIGPTTAVFGLDGSVGSSPARPIAPAGNPIFISRDRRSVMEISYSLQSDANQVRQLSRIAQHLGNAGYEEIVWQGAPEPMAWCRLGDGRLAAMIYDPAEEVLGWAGLPVADGFITSMAMTPDANGSRDVLTISVQRQIGPDVIYMIEELAPIYGVLNGSEPIYTACHLFCSSQYRSEDVTNLFNVPHLAGKSVYAWTDQGQFGPITVPDTGIIELPIAVFSAVIGLFDETHVVETLDLQAAAPDGNSLGRKKRIFGRVGVGLHRTAQGRAATVERDLRHPEQVSAFVNMISQPVAAILTDAYSGITEIEVSSGHAHELALRFRPVGGAPLTVTAIVPTVQEAGR